MRTFRYWAEVVADLPCKGGMQRTRIVAGSSLSVADAEAEGRRRLAWVASRMEGSLPKDDSYEADIREEVLEVLDDRAVVTRNRHGAHVLNVEDLPIFDVDEPRPAWWDLFSSRTPEWREARMLQVLESVARSRPEWGFRLYATAKGFRVMVLGAGARPREKAMSRLAKRLHADPIYWWLCLKQGCYRARLTPKAHRIRVKGIRVPFPPSPSHAEVLQAWEERYLAQGSRFATCRFIRGFGPEVSDSRVKAHDTRTGAFSSRPLA